MLLALLPSAAAASAMGKHLGDKTKALCYFYRHPPAKSGVEAQPYSKIAKLVVGPGKPPLDKQKVFRAVRGFHKKRGARSRAQGWRKTTPKEDEKILKTFFKVRKPLGSAVESRDVWDDLPAGLRRKICLRTVRDRLRQKGYVMDGKKARDDKGSIWRRRRVAFCRSHKSKTTARWPNSVQAVADFRLFICCPKVFKRRHKVKSCAQTILHKSEKNKPAFPKPKHHIFKRSELKRCSEAKVFGLTTSAGQCLVIPAPLYPASENWIKLVREKVGPFLAEAFPNRSSYTVLLDGETDEAKRVMKDCGVRALPGWPSHSPDLNPQENVRAWAEKRLRKVEAKSDSFSTFKRRIIEVSKQYPSKEKLVPSLADRAQECLKRGGANIGKLI